MVGQDGRERMMRRRSARADGMAPQPNRPARERSETTLLVVGLGAMVGVGLAWVALLPVAFEAWSTW
jgi:hypothetical protein